MSKLKIATIGGASSYTPEIIEGFIKRYDKLPIDELWLVDIEPSKERLDIVTNLSRRMVEKAGLADRFKIFSTLNRREAIEGASFVTTQLRVGLLEARIRDERIPLSYGMIGQETNGAGGFAKALRTIPVVLDICKDIEELAPNAWLINFTNPTGILTEALLKYAPKVKTIGLCNVPINMKKSVAEILGTTDDDISFIAGGLNHFLWGREVIYKGKNVTQEALEKILDGAEKGPANINTEIEWVREQVLDTKMIPCPYHRYYYITDEMLREELAEIRDGKGTRGEQVKAIENRLFEIYKNPNLNEKPEELNNRGGKYYSDSACELISSLYNDSGTEMIVSTKNNSTIDCLSNDSAVEITVNVYKDELKHIKQEPYPIEVRGLLQLMKNFEELTVEAAVHGDYGKALQALTVNPLVVSGRVAKTILDEILEKNKEYLPQFFKK